MVLMKSENNSTATNLNTSIKYVEFDEYINTTKIIIKETIKTIKTIMFEFLIDTFSFSFNVFAKSFGLPFSF